MGEIDQIVSPFNMAEHCTIKRERLQKQLFFDFPKVQKKPGLFCFVFKKGRLAGCYLNDEYALAKTKYILL